MNQLVAIVDLEAEPCLFPELEPERRPWRYAVPLVLAAGWGALIACSAVFLFDEARIDTASAATERTPIVEPAAAGRGLVRTVAAPKPVPRREVAEQALAASETGKASAIVRTATAPAPGETIRAPSARPDFIGIWGPNMAACGAQSRRRGFVQATITEDGATAGRTECRFRNGRRDGIAWTMTADCSERGRRWSSQVRLLVEGDHLTWTSAKGPSTYVRCGRKDG